MNAAIARQLGVGTRDTLMVRLGGNEKSLRGQLDLLRAFGDPRELAADVWKKLRAADPAGSATWRWSHVPTLFGATWLAAEQATRDQESAFVHGNPMRGVVRLAAREATKAAQTATDFHGTIAIERLPESAWPLVKSRPAGDSVSRAIREKFDPGGILNPGILGAIS